MQQTPASKIAQSPNNRRPFQRLDEWYQANPNARPGEFDPMGVHAERRRQVQNGLGDTQDRNRLLSEQLWGNFLGQVNGMMQPQQPSPQPMAPPPVQENNTPQQSQGGSWLQGIQDFLTPLLESFGGRREGAMQQPTSPQAVADAEMFFPKGTGQQQPVSMPQQSQPQQPQQQGLNLSQLFQEFVPQYSVDPTLSRAFNGSAFANVQPQFTPDPTLVNAFNAAKKPGFAEVQPQYTVDPTLQSAFNQPQAPVVNVQSPAANDTMTSFEDFLARRGQESFKHKQKLNAQGQQAAMLSDVALGQQIQGQQAPVSVPAWQQGTGLGFLNELFQKLNRNYYGQ